MLRSRLKYCSIYVGILLTVVDVTWAQIYNYFPPPGVSYNGSQHTITSNEPSGVQAPGFSVNGDSASAPVMELVDNSSAANNKKWWWIAPGSLEICAISDAGSVGQCGLQINRSGTNVSQSSLLAGSKTLALKSTGDLQVNSGVGLLGQPILSGGSGANAGYGALDLSNSNATTNSLPGNKVSAPGSNTQISYNSSGSFGASASLTWNDSSNILTLGPSVGTTAHLNIRDTGSDSLDLGINQSSSNCQAQASYSTTGFSGAPTGTCTWLQIVTAATGTLESHVFGTGDSGLAVSQALGMFDTKGNFVFGMQARTTSSTDGFLYAPNVAGIPTGVPRSGTGYNNSSALEFDSTNNRLDVYSGGWKDVADFPTSANFANPTASVGLSVVNGSSTNYMRADAAPPLSQSITPNMTGVWTFTGGGGTGTSVTVGTTGSQGVLCVGNSTCNSNPTPGDPAHALELVSNGAALSGLRLTTYKSGAAFGSLIHFVTANGTQASPTAIQSGDNILSIGARGWDGSEISQSSLGIEGLATENWTTSANGSKLEIQAVKTTTTTRIPVFDFIATASANNPTMLTNGTGNTSLAYMPVQDTAGSRFGYWGHANGSNASVDYESDSILNLIANGGGSRIQIDTSNVAHIQPEMVSEGSAVAVANSGGGCGAPSSVVAGANAGKFQANTTGTCVVTLTPPHAAPDGWTCTAADVSTGVNGVQTTTSTTAATMSIATTSGNTVVFNCMGW